MLEMAGNPLIQGLTTNPSLMKKAGVRDYPAFCKDILSSIKTKPISFEVFADDFAEMEKQAAEINSWGKNVYVKIPVMNSEGKSALPLIETLSKKGVKLNVTAIFTIEQVQGVCKALKECPASVVSVFAGRIADTGRDPIPTMKQALEICRSYGPQMELLWASTRETLNIIQAEQCGCDIITAPAEIIKKMSMLGKDLTEMSLDTIRAFKKDSEAAGFHL